MSSVTDIDGAAKVNSRTHDGNGEKILSVNVTADEDMSDKQGLIVATVGQGGWTKVVGDTSHDAADTNDPIKIGGKARSSEPADVADGDRVDAYFDLKGRMQVGGTVTTSFPADPFGADADAADADGSISAKLRRLAGSNQVQTASGTIQTLHSAITVSSLTGKTTALVQLSTGPSTGIVTFEGSINGSSFFTVHGRPVDALYRPGFTLDFSSYAGSNWVFSIAGLTDFRVRVSNVLGASCNVFIRAVAEPYPVQDWQQSTTPNSGDPATVVRLAGSPTFSSSGATAHDAAGSSTNPVAIGGYASAAAPSDVSADTDVVRSWYLRNGSQCVQLTAAGALIAGDATNGLDVDVTRLPALAAGTNNIGDVDVLTVPSDPFGANADAASATGSISAKLRYIASTGIPVTADTELPAAAALADGASNPTTPTTGSAKLLYNGSTWDRERGTIEGVALASAARTTTTYSDSITNYNCSGVIITWDMTVNGGHNVKMRVQYQDPASSKWQYLHADFGNYSTTGTRTYVIAPSATTSADIVQATAQYLPRTWRIEMTHATANSITYSVGYCMLR